MSYIDRNLLPEERILFRTKKHPIIFFYPLLITLFSIYATDYMHHNFILIKLEWIPAFISFIFWAYVGIEYLSSEYALTNKRVMMREGFFNRHATELRLTTVSQVNVNQSFIGQLLNYGTVSINAFGAYDSFPFVAQPFELQRQINQQLDTLVK